MNLKNDLKLVFTIRKAKEIDIEEILKLWKILVEFHSNLDSVYKRRTQVGLKERLSRGFGRYGRTSVRTRV